MRLSHRIAAVLALASLACTFAGDALAGPETALREFAGGQVKKGVRTIGMGGDGATTGNYALVYRDAGGALFDQGIVRFRDNGNLFTFSAVGWQAGVRVILSHDDETRTQAGASQSGLLQAYEYRLGAAYSPWAGTLFDFGGVGLYRASVLEGTSTFAIRPTLGAEQALVRKRVWARAGLDEPTWSTGMSVAFEPFKIDLAYLYNLAAARTGDVFGRTNTTLIATINFDYEALLGTRQGG